MDTQNKKIVIFGGNGFVGTHVACELQKRGADVVCISRRGHKPLHLNAEPWSSKVRWCKGDASSPDYELLNQTDVVVCCVGSPPLPTLTQQAHDTQYFMNGTTCINAIGAAKEAGVKKVILIGAQVPWPLRNKAFAYFKGKQDAFEAARQFAESGEPRFAVVLQPGMVTGKRILESGRAVRLDLITAPVSSIMRSQFVSAERIAHCVADHALSDSDQGFTVIQNKDI